MSYKELKGKTYIVTGAASGMGRATSLLLAEQGANVALFDLRSPDAVAEEITKAGGKAKPFACNVQDAAAVEEATKKVVAEFGSLDGTTTPCSTVDVKIIGI